MLNELLAKFRGELKKLGHGEVLVLKKRHHQVCQGPADDGHPEHREEGREDLGAVGGGKQVACAQQSTGHTALFSIRGCFYIKNIKTS